jgi:CubicO group peptidase (beta-lactamase class C family)
MTHLPQRYRLVIGVLATCVLAVQSHAQSGTAQRGRGAAQATYFPPANAWEKRTPEQVGLTAKAVADAIALAVAGEATSGKDLLANHLNSFGREPFGEAIGPFRSPRGGASGIIVKNGYIVGTWGDPDRIDHIYSVTKSFVTTTIGLAFDRKMIASLDDPVWKYMAPVVALRGAPAAEAALVPVPPDVTGAANVNTTRPAAGRGVAFAAFDVLEPYESEHNRKITWDHLLRQTSEWQGTLWGKPDWADRPRGDIEQWKTRPRPEPGTTYTYNDVRVNLMALSSLMVWRRPLPQVLKEYVMDPIGASSSWRWYGYDNSWVVLDGMLVQSVAGGAHWGGGMVINSHDMARFGLLTLRNGRWAGRQILSEEWLRRATTPGVNRGYGFANFFLNTPDSAGRRSMQNAPVTAFWHLGNGNNIIYVDRENELVIVARWMNNLRTLDGMVALLTGNRVAGQPGSR